MLAFVFTIAVLNFALGVAAAVAMSHDPRALLGRLRRPSAAPLAGGPEPAGEAIQDAPPPAEAGDNRPSGGAPVEFPNGWAFILNPQGIQPQSFAEAMLHMLRLESADHCNKLMALEQALRSAAKDQVNESTPADAVEQLRKQAGLLTKWAEEFVVLINNRRDSLGVQQPAIEALGEWLLDTVALSNTLLGTLNSTSEGHEEADARKSLQALHQVLEKVYCVRDSALESLAVLLRQEGRIEETPSSWRKDRTTGKLNRLGIETLIAHWLKSDPNRKRLVSAALVEVDRLGKLNERIGTQAADQVLAALADQVDGLVRTDRGDGVVRASGASFFLLLTDSGVAGAKTAVERVRQSLEATTFEVAGEELMLAVNCAVAEMMLDDTPCDLLARLRLGLKEAKKGGRNRTAIDEGSGPALFDAMPMQVKSQTIRIEV